VALFEALLNWIGLRKNTMLFFTGNTMFFHELSAFFSLDWFKGKILTGNTMFF
jgi:hypothetical protein